jgi:mRNA interferase RelE/StbE
MDSYNVILKPSVEKDLRHLPQADIKRIWEEIRHLQDDPFPRQSLKLAGTEHSYRLRVGDYRIIYEVNIAERQIIVHYVRHRRDAYRKL